jgi:lipoprotein-releasing system ATP-binding protein
MSPSNRTRDPDRSRRAPSPAPASAGGAEHILAAADLFKTYRLGRVAVPVLRGATLRVEPGEAVAVLGASGSGKSTLLHLLGGLDRPDRSGPGGGGGGEVLFRGEPLRGRSARALDMYRRDCVGFVFQFYHLLPELSVLDNVLVAAMVRHGRLGYLRRRAEIRARALDLLEAFGLEQRARHRPAELSGGERQRVAIARAVINQPQVLLADEPTGNLDQATGARILDAIDAIRALNGFAMVTVTHDPEVARRARRVVRLVDGRVADEPARAEPASRITLPGGTKGVRATS